MHEANDSMPLLLLPQLSFSDTIAIDINYIYYH